MNSPNKTGPVAYVRVDDPDELSDRERTSMVKVDIERNIDELSGLTGLDHTLEYIQTLTISLSLEKYRSENEALLRHNEELVSENNQLLNRLSSIADRNNK